MFVNPYLLLASILFLMPFAMTEVLGSVVINEIEFDPAGGEAQWIELHNPTNSPVPLDGFEMQLHDGNAVVAIIPIPLFSGDTLRPGGYYVVPMGDSLQHFSDEVQNLAAVLSFEMKTLDNVQGLNDALGSDKTWQRFPDGTDSGTFGDWTFRAATKGLDNGNLGQVVAECTLDPFCWGKLDVFFHNEHPIQADGRLFLIETFYDSKRIEADFVLEEKKILISLISPDFPQLGASSPFLHVTIPDELLGGSYSVLADGEPKPFHQIANQTNTRLIIDHLADEKLIEIMGTRVIPEFPVGSLMVVTVSVFSILVLCRCCGSKYFWKV